MKTLLVLGPTPDLAETIRAGLNPEQYRVLHRANLEEAEPLLAHGVADVCIIDVELTSPQGVWLLDRFRRRAPTCPLIVYTTAKQWEWEEEAYLQGVAHVLTKPVRPRMLSVVLERLWAAPTGNLSAAKQEVPALPYPPSPAPQPSSPSAEVVTAPVGGAAS